MNLQFVQATEAAQASAEASNRGVTAIVLPFTEPLPARPAGVQLFARVDAMAPHGTGVCRDSWDDPSALTVDGEHMLVACPNDAAEEHAFDEEARAASRLAVDGVLLDRPDAWYAADSRGAGFCPHCRDRQTGALVSAYGEQFSTKEAVTRPPASEPNPPFWREREALRLRVAVEHGGRISRRARDEVRRVRNSETLVGARLLGPSAAAVLLAQKLDFVVLPAPAPTPARSDAGIYETFRGALRHRPLVGELDPDTARVPHLVRQASRLAAACGAEVSLPLNAPAESHAALAALRRFWREFRSRHRPVERLTEALLLYSPDADHWTRGVHGEGVRAAAEALTLLGAQYRIILSVPRSGTEPIVLADASALPADDAARLDRRITEGAGAIILGTTGTADETGRPLEGPFGELEPGLNRVGAGTAFVLDLDAPAREAPRKWDSLAPGIEKALESLLGRGRRAASSSRPSMMIKMYVDPDRKLDVHLVGRQFNATTGAPEDLKGVTLYLSGGAVSGARSGYLFTPDAPERKVALTPFGMGVQAALPDFAGSAVLTIAR